MYGSMRINIGSLVSSPQVNFTQVDVTEDCKAIVNGVNDLCGSAGRWAKNFTVTHFVDIFKGSEVKKVVEAGTEHILVLIKSWLCYLTPRCG